VWAAHFAPAVEAATGNESMTDDTVPLQDRLRSLGLQLKEWNAVVDRHFRSLWSFNSVPKGEFEKSIQEAAAAAEQRAGPGPREEGYELLAEVCDTYASADAVMRAVLRDVVGASRDLQTLCLWFAGNAGQQLEATGAPEWLHRAVIAAALADRAPDYRDWYVTLGDVWVNAARHGLDPGAAFTGAAAMAAESSGLPGGSTRAMLFGFENSAYFAESVAPIVRRLDK
jgi:hypothetical protein